VSGVDRYGPELVNLEPSFQPESAAQRREMLSAERPFVRQFEYANAPGYAVVEVDGGTVRASVYCGLGKRLWRTLDLSGLLNA
jgi:hypothetical protein